MSASTKIDRQQLIQIAARAGVDPRSAAKYALADEREKISTKSGALAVRSAVIRAARELGVRPH
jgi:hypothetical protein